MKIAIHFVFFLLFSAIQPTWLSNLKVFGVVPNIFLIYTVIISCYAERKEAAVIGAVSGYILDILIGKIWGLYSILGMILGFSIASFFDKLIGKRNLVMTFILVFLSTILVEFLYYLISANSMSISHAILMVILPECVYNLFASIPLFLLIKKVSRFLYADKGESLG